MRWQRPTRRMRMDEISTGLQLLIPGRTYGARYCQYLGGSPLVCNDGPAVTWQHHSNGMCSAVSRLEVARQPMLLLKEVLNASTLSRGNGRRLGVPAVPVQAVDLPLVIQADGDEQKPASRAEKAAAVLAQVTAGVKQEVEMAEASRAEKAAARLAQITAVAQQEFEMAEANKKNENG